MSPGEQAVDHLRVEDLLEVAAGVLAEVAVRDLGLLAAAAARPQASVFGQDAYTTVAEKAAAIMHSLARNHALVDGNKGLAWAITRVFCLLNARDLAYAVDDAGAVVLRATAGELDGHDLAQWINANLR